MRSRCGKNPNLCCNCFVSTDQTDQRVGSEQHRRPDAPQTLQDETGRRVAESRCRERTGETILLVKEKIQNLLALWY